MRKLTVNPGDRFNKLVVIQMQGVNDKGFSIASVQCDCGKQAVVKVAELRAGHKRSCGCASWKERSAVSRADIVGKRYGRLLVQKLLGADNRKYRLCECLCECGTVVKIRIARMLCGELQSCGCLLQEKMLENLAKAHRGQVTHGLSATLIGRTWTSMMQRCYNPRSESFCYYGAKGIVCCKFLRLSPVNLLWLIGDRPNAAMSIDRIDTMMGYYCGTCEECIQNEWPMNVRWTTAKEQALNRTNNRLIEIDGVIKTASQWCELLGLRKGSKKFYTYPKKT